jgi:ribosomal protein S4E
MDPHVAPLEFAQLHWQKIKKQRPVSIGVDGDHFTGDLFPIGLEDVLEVGGFPAATRSVVNNLAFDLALFQVYNGH